MTSLPTHTPYDGSPKPLTIGLKPLDPADWIEVDGHLLPYLAEKRRLYAEIPERVFVEQDGTRDAQQEVLELLGAYLPERFPDTHRRSDAGFAVVGATSRPTIPSSLAGAPLVAA